MIKFLKRLLLFCSPVLIFYVYLIFYVDPCNYFDLPYSMPATRKAGHFDNGVDLIAKCISFKRDPMQNLLLGGSTIQGFDVDSIRQITHEDYFNFGVTGGGTETVASSFWFASRFTKLKNVYIGISFHTFVTGLNDSDELVKTPPNPVADAIDKLGKPFYYMGNNILKQSLNWFFIKHFSIAIIKPQPPLFDKKTQWSYFLE